MGKADGKRRLPIIDSGRDPSAPPSDSEAPAGPSAAPASGSDAPQSGLHGFLVGLAATLISLALLVMLLAGAMAALANFINPVSPESAAGGRESGGFSALALALTTLLGPFLAVGLAARIGGLAAVRVSGEAGAKWAPLAASCAALLAGVFGALQTSHGLPLGAWVVTALLLVLVAAIAAWRGAQRALKSV